MGVVVRKYIDIVIVLLIPATALAFFVAASLLLCHFKNVISFLFMLFLCDITFEIVQKSKSHRHGNIIVHVR